MRYGPFCPIFLSSILQILEGLHYAFTIPHWSIAFGTKNCAQRKISLQQAGCSSELPISTSSSGNEGRKNFPSLQYGVHYWNPFSYVLLFSMNWWHNILESCICLLMIVHDWWQDIVNFDTFKGLLTEEEQSQLMKFVSSVDLASIPDRWVLLILWSVTVFGHSTP